MYDFKQSTWNNSCYAVGRKFEMEEIVWYSVEDRRRKSDNTLLRNEGLVEEDLGLGGYQMP